MEQYGSLVFTVQFHGETPLSLISENVSSIRGDVSEYQFECNIIWETSTIAVPTPSYIQIGVI